ncbi:E3 ubiquitin-protein ligase FANCL-like [Plodia interpunctella]|uniref:E3 ubiquitin-protein ligase FANCL-like n=1 Tax=Plodia interpunctella TaxID=58824 RepID=UPI002368887A|nr:E3 ubiquitin-protein ligase FANCL-like [Plodia interpunctella]
MDQEKMIQEIFESEKYKSLPAEVSLPALLKDINALLQYKVDNMESVLLGVVDTDFLDEVRNNLNDLLPLYFGKTIRDLKCIIQDDTFREHELYFRYNGPKKLSVSKISIPYSPLQDQVFSSIKDIIVTFKKHLNTLLNYFYQLDRIDRFCTIMEPKELSFKHDHRRILLDERTWLHIEVTPEGLGTNIHLVGQGKQWNEKLQQGLLAWDHDKDIVDNIMAVFDIMNFPASTLNKIVSITPVVPKKADEPVADIKVCNICLCVELPDMSGIPQPLCQNILCGIYFHRNCLFQWLVASSGGRAPAFGVVTGSCPSCLHSISCSEK